MNKEDYNNNGRGCKISPKLRQFGIDLSSELAKMELQADEPQRQKLGQAAQKFAQNYDWRVVAPKFDEIYTQLMTKYTVS